MSRIIVLDDDREITSLVGDALRSEGYEVFTADDGRIGLSSAHYTPVDLLITDLVMPGMEGIETIRRFRREFPRIPIIAISGNPNVGSALDTAIRLGAVRTLSKPFQPQELVELVKSVLPGINPSNSPETS